MALRTLGHARELTTGISEARLTALGVAYKGGVSDTRRTPTRRFVQLAENDGYEVTVTDPYVTEFERPVESLPEAAIDSDCLVLLTDHDVYQSLSPEDLAELMRQPAVVDTRGMLDPDRWGAAGFAVHRLGDGSGVVEAEGGDS
jgi:UDP-N-acetyl-D-mannosaminuronic acid dehydrogenase